MSTIDFNNIPSGIRKPGVYSEYNDTLANQGLPANAKKMVILAQKRSSGIGVDNVPVQIFSSSDAILQCGQGSVGALAANAALIANKRVDLWIVPIPDAAGAAAVGTITVSGIASSTGSFVFWIGNVRMETTVNDTDAVNDIAAAIKATIDENASVLPVTASILGAVITLTAKNLGTLGNNIPVSYLNNNVGTTDLAIVQPTSGATDPSIATALTAIFPANYHVIMCTLNDATNLGLLKQHLIDSADPQEGRRSTGHFGYTGVQATIETLAGTTLNYERLNVAYLPYGKTTKRGHSLDYEIGAANASIVAGREDPALPYTDEPLFGIAPSALENQLSRSQQESLLDNGVTPLQVGSGETVTIVRQITTYTTTANGTLSTAWLDLTSMTSMDFGTFAIETRQKLVFAQTKLTAGTMAKLKTEIADVIRLLALLEIWNPVELDEIIVEPDIQAVGRANTQIPGKVVPGLLIIANRIDLILNSGSL